jgi:hypothetical protein
MKELRTSIKSYSCTEEVSRWRNAIVI